MRHQGTFKLETDFRLQGDQPAAVRELVAGIEQGLEHQVLLGVTGSGKTFTMANVIERLNRPALVLAPNKTLAAQLYSEFKQLFPSNAVRYFVSYYDYYQPEAYVPSTDTYIEKDSAINDEIDKMRHSATRALLERSDVLIVASVSCIYGLGTPEDYFKMLLFLEEGQRANRDEVMRKLVAINYQRDDADFHRGTFRVRGDIVEIFPVYEDARALRVEFFDDEVESIKEIDPLRGTVNRKLERLVLYPASHYVTTAENMKVAIERIRNELGLRGTELRAEDKALEAQRLEQRTLYDIEMLEEMGVCTGIENYSRHLAGRHAGETPATLLHYFPDDFVAFLDESHISVSQVGGMYRADRSRKNTLVDFGFRLPSALDNRPLTFEEFGDVMGPLVYVSATPGDYELEKSAGVVVEQLVRPTGLVDPEVEVRGAGNQVDDLLDEVRLRVERDQRVLVTTLTKKMAEDLSEYYDELGIKVRYLHSDVVTLERVEILRDLRRGVFDVLVGINLLREGLDLPEVSLVAILDADKEGFLRSARSLIQTMGRAARHIDGKVIMYADRITGAMEQAMDETARRREMQEAYNKEHGIEPRGIERGVDDPMVRMAEADYGPIPEVAESSADYGDGGLRAEIESLRRRMKEAAAGMDFEKAAELRDKANRLEQQELGYGG
ncbi:MAG TPA: excinuclease ABC subunit UvrB [Deltaproteobacteria bacterium]|nr:excinuclease ABC subunit UvrB [Deltaproteobacteria bacterium]